MSSTSFSSSAADLPAVLHNAARRFAAIATSFTLTNSGASWTVVVVWPDDVDDPGDPGPDPAVVTLGAALSTVTDTLTNEQTRVSILFAERIDLQKQRTELAVDKAALQTEKALAEQLLTTAQTEKATLEQQLVLKQKEIDDLKAGGGVAGVKP